MALPDRTMPPARVLGGASPLTAASRPRLFDWAILVIATASVLTLAWIGLLLWATIRGLEIILS
jgi:hypothetical protein